MKRLTTSACVLVVSDSASNAGLVRKAIEAEFEDIQVWLNPGAEGQAREFHSPTVLVLAYDTLAVAQRNYLAVCRQSIRIQAWRHRAIVLCRNTEVRRAYELCREQLFDQYVQFWPMTTDPTALAMAVHTAQRELAVSPQEGPSEAEWAAQARKLEGVDVLLERRLVEGSKEIDQLSRTLGRAEQRVGNALDALAQRILASSESKLSNASLADEVQTELARIKREEVSPPSENGIRTGVPLHQWVSRFRADLQPALQSTRSLQVMAKQVRPTILVVDDDEFQRKAIEILFRDEEYRVLFATNGIQALHVLREVRPDLILIDMMMPDMDGAETTRRIKSSGRFAHIPVVMMTGSSSEFVVSKGIEAGAIDFVVKPFNRATLIDRVTRALASTE